MCIRSFKYIYKYPLMRWLKWQTSLICYIILLPLKTKIIKKTFIKHPTFKTHKLESEKCTIIQLHLSEMSQYFKSFPKLDLLQVRLHWTFLSNWLKLVLFKNYYTWMYISYTWNIISLLSTLIINLFESMSFLKPKTNSKSYFRFPPFTIEKYKFFQYFLFYFFISI